MDEELTQHEERLWRQAVRKNLGKYNDEALSILIDESERELMRRELKERFMSDGF